MRVLDELADAFQAARGRWRRRNVISSDRLQDQLDGPINADEWAAMERHLSLSLPPLQFDQGHWWLPNGLTTVWDVAASIAARRPDWEPPGECSASVWREAQVFAGVRSVLVEAGNLDHEQVTRQARLGADLGLE
jgi:hypothetical protein